MKHRIWLATRTDFLRLVLRQLLRKQAGIEIAFESGSLAEPHDAAMLIAELDLVTADQRRGAEVLGRYRGRTVLIGEGAVPVLPSWIRTEDVCLVAAGSESEKLQPAQLSVRLDQAIQRFTANAFRQPVPEPIRKPAARTADPAPDGQAGWHARRPGIVAIAASTGGPEAIQALLSALSPPPCPVVIALHIPADQTAGLARYLTEVTSHPVIEGIAGSRLPPSGVVLLRGGIDYALIPSASSPTLRQRSTQSVFHPNGDQLLASAAALGCHAVGVVLTGMGNDGAVGAQALAGRQYPVLAQRPESCAVPGMPSAAIATGAVSHIATPAGIAARLNAWFALAA